MNMQDTWQRFIAALTSYSPALVARLNPGADDAAISRAEQRLGVLFTEEVKEFFHLHNGSNGPLFGSWALLSLDEMCEDWLAMKEKFPFPVPSDDDAYYSWKETWLPLLRVSPFVRLYIRIDPKDELLGEDGLEEEALHEQERTFAFQHGGKISHERLGTLFLSTSRADFVAASINEFLANLTHALENKEYVYDEEAQKLWTLSSTTSRLFPINESGFDTLEEDFPEAEYFFDDHNFYLTFGDDGVEQPFADHEVDLVSGVRVAYPGLCCLPERSAYCEPTSTTELRTIAQSWDVFRACVGQIAPEISDDFSHGMSTSYLQFIEEQMQMQFPEDMKIWYSLCNGTTWEDSHRPQGCIDFWDWFSLEDLRQRWMLFQACDGSRPITGEYLTSADPRIQPVWWHPRWLPFMCHADGSVLCMDLAPTAAGTTGQIILLSGKSMFYGSSLDIRRMPPVVWITSSLRQFLSVFAQDLSEGRYTFDGENKMLWSQEGLAYIEEDKNFHILFARRCRQHQEKNEQLRMWQAFFHGDLPSPGEIGKI